MLKEEMFKGSGCVIYIIKYIAMVKNTMKFILSSPEPFIYVGVYTLTIVILISFTEYLKLLYTSNPLYKNVIKYITYVHNTGLFLFSLLIWLKISAHVYALRGTINSVVLYDNLILEDEYLMKLCWYFTYSKVWEFLDTYLIMLRGNNTISLQKFHHAGALLTWYLVTKASCLTIVFSTQLNAFIHTIMYAYYPITSTGRKLNRIKPVITILQLVQLVSGFYCSYQYYVKPFYTSNDVVPVNVSIVALSMCIDSYRVVHTVLY
jgi:hypothetical protein